ncbi:succinate dehydrogenase, hydrophobic membrane anchor protein [Arenimonas caeni]|jgi:succinate dehydrogenase / fumarate reductase membrane anchor subunit|uniref:Succinate dehydrogenase hydrophobic membrane anchor subunit n=1 Tax=Arenimonas caeni TaxID=2058085 RepID=A0A2P6MBB9_9GAMM|nr:succinate dehydrogenase, hydrophobic membrane anchor protein [Arenimonas caeni]MDY0022624.1 succinate dehydrogenase, hydrophobic membrane anchor protein [Arenimonas caeni]PRH83274.1 succinate dehydrogenase, hydrophobic membrane anchor protein [Arenimonas caeni]
MSLRNPLARAKGLGSAKDGTTHWWHQRLSAIALLLLTPWFVILMVGLIGDDLATVRATLSQPLTAILMTAFVLSLFWHARLGLQVVIEDYLHGGTELLMQVIVKFAYALAAIASLLAIGRLFFLA